MVELPKSFAELKSQNPELTDTEYSQTLATYRQQKAEELGISLHELHRFAGRAVEQEVTVLPIQDANHGAI